MAISHLVWILAMSLPLAHGFNCGVAWRGAPVRSPYTLAPGHQSFRSCRRKEHAAHTNAKKVQLTATEKAGEGTVHQTEQSTGADELTLQDLVLASAMQVCYLPLPSPASLSTLTNFL